MTAQAKSNFSGGASSSTGLKNAEEVLAETEQQWLYTEAELQRTPSIIAGMNPDEERILRTKGVNFITQVGVMLKLPQTTISTASVFFHRFLMRYNLVGRNGLKPLHHYQIAAVSIFVATKVEEHSRKLKEIVIACCRVAQKNPGLLVDEQTKDYWRWKDTIVLNEDLMLEYLCFDLTLESPYTILYNLVKEHGVATNKKLRETAWSFINDSCMTQLSLLFPARTIACAALYCGARFTRVQIKGDAQGRPWWEAHDVKGLQLRRAYNHMAAFFENAPLKSGADNIYIGGLTPLVGDDQLANRTQARQETSVSPDATAIAVGESSRKRIREEDMLGDDASQPSTRIPTGSSRIPAGVHLIKEEREVKKSKLEDHDKLSVNGSKTGLAAAAGSEDGELED